MFEVSLPVNLSYLLMAVNIFVALTLILDNSSALYFACCTEDLNAFMIANIMLIAAIIFSATLLAIFAYISVEHSGDIQFDACSMHLSEIPMLIL